MKHTIFLLLALTALGTIPCVAATPPSLLIVPGQRIGMTRLGPQGAASLARLPRPDASDVGMSQQRLVWVSKHAGGRTETLYLHTVANGALNVKPLSGVTIDEIRVTSSAYRTRGGIGSGSTFAAIRRAYPRIRPESGSPLIYEDTRRGIAFEFASRPRTASRSIAVTVMTHGGLVEGAATVANVLKGGRG